MLNFQEQHFLQTAGKTVPAGNNSTEHLQRQVSGQTAYNTHCKKMIDCGTRMVRLIMLSSDLLSLTGAPVVTSIVKKEVMIGIYAGHQTSVGL